MSTHKEKLEHLLAGGKLKESAGYKFLDSEGNMIWESGRKTSIIDLDNGEIYQEPKWYESLHESPVLCWVWNDNKIYKVIRLIINLNNDCHNKFLDSDSHWENAEPITEDELKQYIWSNNK